MNLNPKLLLILTLFFVSIFPAFSDDDYDIEGIIIDKETNKPLIGASVQLVGTKKGTISNKKGKFELDDIELLEATIKITYIGYSPYELKVNKKNSKDLLIQLTPISSTTDEVQVTAKAEGKVKAMLEQKEAISIKNIVSQEQIAQFPDLNAAEAMQRIPGITLQRDQGEGKYVQLRGTPPELTNFNINGEQIPSPEGGVRFVGMDIIAADQIEFIEISKVLTPDMDADGIAGNVNIVTKKAESEIPKINATISGGYNNLRQSDNYQVQYSYGQRYQKFGFNVNGSYYKNNQGSDNMEFKYAKGPFWGSTGDGKDNYYVQYREAQLRHYDITRTRLGISTTLDYEFDKNSSLYLRGMFNSFSDDEIRRRKIYELDDALSFNYYLYGGIEQDVRQRTKDQDISTLSLGGENKFDFIEINYELSYGIANESQPNYFEVRFDNPGQAIGMKFDVSDPDYPRVTYPDPENAQNATDYANYEMNDLIYQSSKINDANKTGKIDFKIPFKFDDENSGFIKFGTKYRHKDKTRDINAQNYGAYFTKSSVYPGEGPKLSLETVNDGFQVDNLLNKSYQLEYIPSANMMRDFFEYYSQFFIYDRTGTKVRSNGEDYKASEDILGVYGMVRYDWNKLMVIGGLRYESTDIDYEGRRIITAKGKFTGLDTLRDKRNHSFILPQLQFKYTFDNNTNIRAGVTYTYSRPNFEDVLPYRQEDREEVKYGNPNLVYPTSLNFDLLGEHYMTKGGIISGGLFYKKIDNFIFYYKRFAHEGTDFSNYGLVEIEKAVNGINAFVYGAELQAQYKFEFLPSFFENFGVFFNYTYTYSEAYINKRLPANYANSVVIFEDDDLTLYNSTTEQEQIKLPGQAAHTLNLAIFYESDDFYAKLSSNFHDAFLYQLGADPDLDVYYDKALHLDLTVSYQLNDNLKLFTDFINLTNAPLKYYLAKPDQIQVQEYYSWWSRIGLKINF